ncbi:MAG: FecR domain-containing protein [Lentisphaeraceae bacterium]|nr:FecR domain-containing protein [Lentisphaeraceae bacterium]
MHKSNEQFFDGDMTEIQKKQHLESLENQIDKDTFLEQWRLHKTLENFLDEDTGKSQANEIIADLKSRNFNNSDNAQKNSAPQGVPRTILWRSISGLAAAAILILSLTLLWTPQTYDSSKIIHVSRNDKTRQNFTLTSGVKIKVLDNTRYVISGDNSLKLISGHIEADVPPSAMGFTVETANGQIRDISTRFSVKADKQKTEAFVLKGQVEVYFDKSTTKTLVKENEAVALHKDIKKIENIPFKKHDTIAGFEGSGDVISINFALDKDVSGACGYIKSANWNNIRSKPNDMPMTNNQGEKTQITLNISSFLPFGNLHPKEPKTDIQHLFQARLNKTALPHDEEQVKETLEISLKNIPYKNYDVIVYYWIKRSATDHIFDLQVNDSKKIRIHRPTADSLDSENEFIPWRGVGRNLSGNMLISKNCSGSSATIKATLPLPLSPTDYKNIYRSWYICGLQIIER